jgi:hypothetical protein
MTKYLLNEYHDVEQDFSDALNPAHRGSQHRGTQYQLGDQPARISDVERLAVQVNGLKSSVDRLQSAVTMSTSHNYIPPSYPHIVSLLSHIIASLPPTTIFSPQLQPVPYSHHDSLPLPPGPSSSRFTQSHIASALTSFNGSQPSLSHQPTVHNTRHYSHSPLDLSLSRHHPSLTPTAASGPFGVSDHQPHPSTSAAPAVSHMGNWQYISPPVPLPACQSTPPPASQASSPVVPTVRNWEGVITDWEEPDESRRLYVALSQWDIDTVKKLPQHQKVLYGNRKLIADMYINVCVFSHSKFNSRH